MGERKFDNKYIRKYWGKVFLHAYSPVASELAMRAAGILFILVFFVLLFSAVLTLLGTTSIEFFSSQLDNFKSVLSASGWTFAVLSVLIIIGIYRSAAELDHKKQEMIDNYSSEQLKLWIDEPANLIYDNWGAEPPFKICLPLNVISGEKQKIIDLEAHLLSVDYLTEDQTDAWNHNPYIEKTRLEWEGGDFQIELKPGIQELKKLRIAVLNCSNREFKFSHENNDRIFPYYQVNAIYKIEVGFQGRLEGSYNYQSFSTVVDFVCVPLECVLDFLPGMATSSKLPTVFRQILGQSHAT